MHLTAGSVHDVQAMDQIVYEPGSFYVFDKAYLDIAVITYTLVAIIRQRLKTAYTTYEVLQILGSSLLDKTPINQLLKKTSDQDVKELLYNQLKIW